MYKGNRKHQFDVEEIKQLQSMGIVTGMERVRIVDVRR